MPVNDLIIKILEIINYRKDREKYVSSFVTTVSQIAVGKYLETLSDEKKKTVSDILNNDKSLSDLKNLTANPKLDEIFKTPAFEKIKTDTVNSSINMMLEEVKFSLNADQKSQIEKLMSQVAAV